MDVVLSNTTQDDYQTFTNQEDSKSADGHFENIVDYDKAIDAIGFGKYHVLLLSVAGFSWIADGMEILVLSILTNELKKEWNLSTFQVSFMVSIVFVGSFVGSLLFGFLSDKYGRKKCLIASSLLLAAASISSSFSQNYIVFSITRFLVGVAFTGNIQIDTYCTEITPTKYRSHAIFTIMFFWPIGGILAVVLGHYIGIENGLWHKWLLWLTVTSVIFFVFTLIIPESSRFLLKNGQKEEALRNLKKMAKMNSSQCTFTEITSDDTSVDYGFFKTANIIIRTISLCYVWLSAGGIYYGIILYTTLTIEKNADKFHVEAQDVTSQSSEFTFHYYLISTAVEIPGYLIGILTCELLGRKKSLCMAFIVISVCYVILFFTASGLSSVIVLCIARIFIVTPNTIMFLYTNELYPTNIRAFSLGLGNMFYRFGALLTPYIVEFLFEASLVALNSVYMIWAFSAFLMMLCLIETKGKPLD